ncbi:XdhC family protein [Pantoea sp. KPR_PJ]|uniref:XdhC family protein n=1 Tax=Pantoea sp. KPR_PJ TaxID=2738375 RepID=UPI0035275FFA
MHNLDMQVLSAGLQWVSAHEVWLCTVLSTYGSSPRPPGAMMVIRKGGYHCGSLSGGCVEESFIERIRQDAFSAASQVVRYGEGGFEPDRALPCGGVLDILVEKLPPGEASIAYLQQMHDALTAATAVKKKIILPHPCYSISPATYTSRTLTSRDGATVTLTLSTAPRLVIGGLSSVALFCANFAVALGFETVVCEHREDVLDNMTASLDSHVILIKQFPAVYLEREGCHAGTAILSLTHDPRIDDLTMMEAVNLPAFYIGAMGSKKNSMRRKARLGEYGDLRPEQISRIHAPVGIDIGSKTPAEIALSVLADIVRHKNGCALPAEAPVEPLMAQEGLG